MHFFFISFWPRFCCCLWLQSRSWLHLVILCIGVVCSRGRVIEFSGAISLLAHFSFFPPSSTAVENFGIKGHFCDIVSPLNAVKWRWKTISPHVVLLLLLCWSLEGEMIYGAFTSPREKNTAVPSWNLSHSSSGFPLMKLNIPLSVSNPPSLTVKQQQSVLPPSFFYPIKVAITAAMRWKRYFYNGWCVFLVVFT